jgi:hypothetical protein
MLRWMIFGRTVQYPAALYPAVVSLSLLTAAALAASPAIAANDTVLPSVSFKATAIQTAGAYQNKETVYYADGKLRIERGRGFSTTILDMNTETQCILMANQTYLVLPMDDELYRRFFPMDPKFTEDRRLGTEQIEGMQTTHYEFGGEDALKASGTFWLSSSNIMLRRDYADGLFGKQVHHHDVLQDVSVGPQPASLFEIPAGYRKAK